MVMLGRALFGGRPRTEQVPTMTPEQQQYQNMLLQGAGQGLQGGGLDWLYSILSGDPGAFQDFEAPLMRQFEQDTLPAIAERFAGMGSGGALGSSGFRNAGVQAGSELTQNLAQLRAGLKSQALQQLAGLGQMGMQPSFENVYNQGQTGFFPGLAGGLGGGIGQGLSYWGMNRFMR